MLNKENPSETDYLNLGLKYYNEGEYQRCLWTCEEALKIKPGFAEAYNNMCAAYNSMGLYDRAIIACEKCLKFRPDFQIAKNNLKWAKAKHATEKLK